MKEACMSSNDHGSVDLDVMMQRSNVTIVVRGLYCEMMADDVGHDMTMSWWDDDDEMGGDDGNDCGDDAMVTYL